MRRKKLAQRGEDISRERPARAAANAAKVPAVRMPRPGKKRLGFNDKHALRTLPVRIATLEATIHALAEKLADANLYGRDRNAFEEASRALAAAQRELAAAEDKWLELEIRREEIEGG